MPDARHDEIVSLVKGPIRPDAPVGDPVRYDESFERLQAQLDRSGSLTGEETEWRTVVELASDILKSKSKDLLVMTYFSLGIFEVEGYKGLAAAFEGYIEFLKAFWDACFPKVKPPQGRLNAVQYMIERLMPLVELKGGTAKKEPGGGEKEAVHACTAKVEELDKVVVEKFTGMPDSPNMMQLVRAFQALRTKVGPLIDPAKAAADAAAKAAAAAAAGGAEGGEGAARPAAPGGGVVSSFASPAQAMDQVKRIARYLLEQDNKDARAYRLSRLALLGSLIEPKDRFVPPVSPPTIRTTLENLAGAGDWPALLNAAENQFLNTPLWLDLQRFVATALNGMGPMYSSAKLAVILEVVALQNRLPNMFELYFKDGKPFADAATKAWLTDARTEIGAGGAGGGSANGDRLSAALSDARKLLGDAKPGDAVARLGDEIGGSASRRDQFRAQLALARFFLDMNKPAMAESLLEGLNALISQYNLEEWEPVLAAETLQCLFDGLCKSRPRPTPDDVRHRAEIFGRLCRLDPASALKFEGLATAAKAPSPAAAPAAGAGGAKPAAAPAAS